MVKEEFPFSDPELSAFLREIGVTPTSCLEAETRARQSKYSKGGFEPLESHLTENLEEVPSNSMSSSPSVFFPKKRFSFFAFLKQVVLAKFFPIFSFLCIGFGMGFYTHIKLSSYAEQIEKQVFAICENIKEMSNKIDRCIELINSPPLEWYEPYFPPDEIIEPLEPNIQGDHLAQKEDESI
jgi:hypothetical protein